MDRQLAGSGDENGEGAPASVDAVIVTYNSRATLADCVSAVRRWPRSGKIVVVDNCSSDESVDLARTLADEVMVMRHNVGFGAGQNAGLAATTSDWVLLLNPDAQVEPDGLEEGWSYASSHPRIALIEGEIRRSIDGRPERWCGQEPGIKALLARLLRLRERIGEVRLTRLATAVGVDDYAERAVSKPTEVQFLAAVAPLVRRTAIDDVGGFDERIFLYGEDVELGHRLRSAGWTLVAMPSVWAQHVGGASSSGKEAMRERMWWESHRRLVEISWRGWRRWAGLAITAVGSAVSRRAVRHGK